jgi:hypothetical protein
MVGENRISGVRAFGLGLTAVFLAACASVPMPATTSRPVAAAPRLPYDPDAPPHVVEGLPPSQCVPFARQESGIDIYGDANTWWMQAAGRYPRSSSPATGSVLVMRGYNDSSRGHVAVVRRVVSSRIILVDHANWMNHGEITVNVPVLDVSDANDWSQVRVWWIPLSQWGARIYSTEGFIHPFLLQAAIG